MLEQEIKKLFEELFPHLTPEESRKILDFILAVQKQDVVNFLKKK